MAKTKKKAAKKKVKANPRDPRDPIFKWFPIGKKLQGAVSIITRSDKSVWRMWRVADAYSTRDGWQVSLDTASVGGVDRGVRLDGRGGLYSHGRHATSRHSGDGAVDDMRVIIRKKGSKAEFYLPDVPRPVRNTKYQSRTIDVKPGDDPYDIAADAIVFAGMMTDQIPPVDPEKYSHEDLVSAVASNLRKTRESGRIASFPHARVIAMNLAGEFRSFSRRQNPAKTKKKASKKKAVKNPHSKVSLAIAKWYEKKGYMTPEIKMALARAGNPNRLLSRLYVNLVRDDVFLHWNSFRSSDEHFVEFEREAGVKRRGLQKLMDLGLSYISKINSGKASPETDKVFESLSKGYGKMANAIGDGDRLFWYWTALGPLANSNEALSRTWRDINNPAGISGTLDDILKYIVRPKLMLLRPDSALKDIFQKAILRATHKSADEKGRTLPHTRRNPAKSKATKNPPANCSPIYVAGERYEYADPQQLGIYARKSDAMREVEDQCDSSGADHNIFVTRYDLKGSRYKAAGMWLCKKGSKAFKYIDYRKRNPKGKTKKVPWSASDIKGMEEFVERKLGTKKKVAKKKVAKKKAAPKKKAVAKKKKTAKKK